MLIVFFHVLYLLGKLVFRRYGTNDVVSDVDEDDDDFYNLGARGAMGQDAEDVGAKSKAMKERTNLKRRLSGGDELICEERKSTIIRFSPPAYIQRYQAVLNVLTDSRYGGKLKKVVDFGCSELGFFLYLKNMVGVQEALFVDVDRTVLELYKEKVRPLHVDYLHRRSTPLVVRVLEGSVTQHDKYVENCDAVVCIELVEHLYPEPLTNLPYSIFGFIRPKVAVITTPNADFNVLFENMKGFRHPDHKFEWTRKQFQDWAYNIVTRFPEYEVTFQGICNGPPGTEDLGACSQMAVFHKSYDLTVDKLPAFEGLYNPIVVHDYPYQIDNRSDEEKILDDAVYFIRKFSYNDHELAEEVSLQKLLNVMRNFYISLNDLKEILENANWTVIDREEGPVVLVPPPSSFSDHSIIEDDFLDHDYPPGYDDWMDEEPGPPVDYFDRNAGNDINVVEEENWENDPHIIVPPAAEFDNRDTENNSFNTELVNSTPSIYPDDVSLDDIVTESRSAELANSVADESIFISSFSETKDSSNTESVNNSCSQIQASSTNIDNKIAEISNTFFSSQIEAENKLENSVNDSTDTVFSKNTSVCSIFLEPSKMSRDVNLEDLSDSILESTITSPLVTKSNKKLKLNNCTSLSNLNENTFEEPQYTSSPHVPPPCIYKKRKAVEQMIEHSSSGSNSSSTEDLILCTNDTSKDVHNKNDYKFDDPNKCSNESVIAESNLSSGYSPQTNDSECSEKVRHYTGTIPKNFNGKVSETRVNAQTETKIERISPDTPQSSPNSWSPEIMDSGYPNSNSPPDLSPEYDLSSIAHDRTSDSESPSIADAPRLGFLDLAEVENRDLANNNLDGEGNNMEAEENQHINDLRPLINVLENDLENENDIYVVRNGFPIWLLRILQRFDADGVGINLPMLQAPNENFGD